ncbi:MAG: hypothetical protein AVDCRST_MAG21-1468, partial [uncultured Nocardioidaceae bacterium]
APADSDTLLGSRQTLLTVRGGFRHPHGAASALAAHRLIRSANARGVSRRGGAASVIAPPAGTCV